MHLHRHTFFILVTAFLCGAATCEREISWELEEDVPRQLVIISDFEPGELLHVEVKRTLGPFDDPDEEEYIDNAYVRVTEIAGTQPTERLEYIPRGQGDFNWSYYQSQLLRPIVGMEYQIEVSVPGYDDVSAVSMIPIPVDIRDFEIFNTSVTPIDETTTRYDFSASLKFDDPSDQENYYQIKFSQQIHEYTLGPMGDTLIDGNKSKLDFIGFKTETSDGLKESPTGRKGIFFKDDSELIFDLTVQVDPTKEILGQLFIDFRTVSKEYYRYFSNAGRQFGVSSGISPSPTLPVISNVNNGQGVFAGYSARLDSIPVPIVN